MADRVAVSELRLDDRLYPRARVDADHVARLGDAMEMGADLPPVIAWSKGRQVIDGFHRVRAVRIREGDEGQIDVEWREYGSRAEAFEDAVRLNAQHGLKFDRVTDFPKLRERAVHLGLKPDRIASVLKVPMKRLEKAPPKPMHGSSGGSARPQAAKALRHLGGHDPELAKVVNDLTPHLTVWDGEGPGRLPERMAAIQTARKTKDNAGLRQALLEAAALFIWWAARTPADATA